jgi:hypothetical protein
MQEPSPRLTHPKKKPQKGVSKLPATTTLPMHPRRGHGHFKGIRVRPRLNLAPARIPVFYIL